MNQDRESIDFDIVFIGAGPANLSAAIHLQQLIRKHNATASKPIEAEIAILEKSRNPGGHLLSGAVIEPGLLSTLLPQGTPNLLKETASVGKESIWFLTRQRRVALPFIPEPLRNNGNIIVSLSELGRALAAEAERLDIPILDATAATMPVIEDGRLQAVITDTKGTGRNGLPRPGSEPGMRINARAFVIGEGAHGSLTRQLSQAFGLHDRAQESQRYETGVKEVWEIPSGRLKAGELHHTFGYPLPASTYGGGWLYAMTDTRVSMGFVTAIEPKAPLVAPHANLQLFKAHPFIARILEGGRPLEYGAKTITSGGWNAMPELHGPGFLLVGESAGLLDLKRLKGVHLALQSGIMAAEVLFSCLDRDDFSATALSDYRERFMASPVKEGLLDSRDYRKGFDEGLYKGLLKAGLKLSIPGISGIKPAAYRQEPPLQPKKDSPHYLSREDALFLSGTSHEEDQPCHLHITREDMLQVCSTTCRETYGNPCQYFCPAGVYEIDPQADPILKLNPANCLHCKTCEIIDPFGVITWVPPEGGGGPDYKLS